MDYPYSIVCRISKYNTKNPTGYYQFHPLYLAELQLLLENDHCTYLVNLPK